MKLLKIFPSIALLASLVATAHAGAIAMSGPDSNGVVSYYGSKREGWLSKATSGWVVGPVTGTPQAADVGALFGGTWAKEGELTGNGTNDLLSVALTDGAWNGNSVTGDWAIDSSFWSTYGNAVISIHVGNGAGDPDWLFWHVKAGELSGEFYYKRIAGGGGGLSNVFLWGSGDPVDITTNKVPDGGFSMILVGLGLLTLALFRRKLRA